MLNKSRRLVVLRAGANSLHRNWIGTDRSWELAISSFQSDRVEDFPEAEYFHYFKGGKWDGIYAFFQSNPGLLDEFDYFWLPDDDIDVSPENVELIFDKTETYKLEVSQPSLTKNSYFWHPITLRSPFSRLRYTNFVEIMVPVLSRSVFKKTLPLFSLTKSGFGLDFVLSRLTSDPAIKCAILDEVAVHHTRPVGSVLAKSIIKDGSSGPEEMQKMSAVIGFDLEKGRPVVFRLKTRFGFDITGQWICGSLVFLCQFPWLSGYRTRRSGARVFGGSVYSHFTHVADLTPLTLDELVIPSNHLKKQR